MGVAETAIAAAVLAGSAVLVTATGRPGRNNGAAPPEGDRVIQALTALEAALEDNVRRATKMSERIAEVREQRAAGRSYTDIVGNARPPLIVELLTESARALDSSGALVRRMEALALYHEGMTMEDIARLFGVTRQRVSALLRDARQPRYA